MDALLEPISADAPTGEDLSYDPIYNELAVLILGTPETQFSEAKDPSWPAVRKQAEEGLKRSKDLQIAIYYAVALTQTGGLEGGAKGMELISGLVRQYWVNVHPQLDPDDNDPTQRLNILSQLTVEPGSYGDPVKYIDRLSSAAIFRAPGLGPITLNFLKTDSPAPGGGSVLGSARLPEIVANSNPEEVAAGLDALRRVLNAVHSLDDFLIETLGRGVAPSFELLIKALDKGLRPFDALIGGSTPAEDEAGGAGTAGGVEGSGSGGVVGGAVRRGGTPISGEIQSPEDVRRTLQKICDYYATAEPSSPVPILLKRAQRLVGKSFLDLLDNLAPGGRAEIDVIAGPVPEDETSY